MNSEDLIVIKNFIKYLNSDSIKEEVKSDGFHIYSKEIQEFWEYCQDNNIFLEYNGKEREYLRDKDINDMNIEEIRKNLDIIFYGERIAWGNIMHNINNKRLISLLERLVVLYNDFK